MSEKLQIKGLSFENGEWMDIKYTGFGEDISPCFKFENLCDEGVSIVIIMDDMDVPFMKEYNHWLIFNIPHTKFIPEAVPCGEVVENLGGAIQGKAYGKNRYRGPKQPVFIKSVHRYIFKFYVLDCFLNLDSSAKKEDVLLAMEGHILQEGSILGKYKR